MTIQIKNMQLLNQLRENMTNFDKLNEHFEINIHIINQFDYDRNVEKIDYKSSLTKSKNVSHVDVIYVKREKKKNFVKLRTK
jgi:hypothetical protein